MKMQLKSLTPFWAAWASNIGPDADQKDVQVLSYIFLKNPPIAAPLLHHFTPSEKITPLTLTPFYPLQPTLTWQFQSVGERVSPEKSSHCSPTLTSFYPI